MTDDFNNDSLLELYLYESTSLLDSLDNILLTAESDRILTKENINEIFRIMHTIKGSSAMMAYAVISEVAHKTEDLFSLIRDVGILGEYFDELFDNILATSDFLKNEIGKLEAGEAPGTDIPSITDELAALKQRIQTSLGVQDEGAKGYSRTLGTPITPSLSEAQMPAISSDPDIPLSGAEPLDLPDLTVAEASEQESDTPDLYLSSMPVAPEGGRILGMDPPNPATQIIDADISKVTSRLANTNGTGVLFESTTYHLHIHFNEGSRMENIRAFMLVNKLNEKGTVERTIPDNLENNPDAASQIIEHGLYISFTTAMFREQIEILAKGTLSVETVSFVRRMPDEPNSAAVPKFMQMEPPSTTPKTYDDMITGQPKDLQRDSIKTNAIGDIDSEYEAPAFTRISSSNEAASGTAQVSESPAAKGLTSAPADADSNTADHKQTYVPTSGGGTKQSIISVDLKKLDSLLDIVGEIVISESLVTENSDLRDLELANFDKAAWQLGKLVGELQDSVMSIRMLPVSVTFQRMRRIVRDMSKTLSKDAELILVGESTEVDKTILDALNDPIMHLVRNAMDHGLESPMERAAAGKNSIGHVVLSAQNSGSDVIISVSDDGRGLDKNVILEKAKEKGLLRKPVSEYTEKEIYNFLMSPGFSTKQDVTDFSGRGVGMDVVKSNIEKIGGTVILESKQGHGTNVMLKIPLTLAIISCMEISLGKDIYSIPISNIRESFKASSGQLISDPLGNEMIMLRGVAYSVIRLYEKFGIQNAIKDIADGILVLVESGDQHACLLVDDLVGKFQVVVKPTPKYLNRFGVVGSGISGCTIMGNGNISLIISVQGLVE